MLIITSTVVVPRWPSDRVPVCLQVLRRYPEHLTRPPRTSSCCRIGVYMWRTLCVLGCVWCQSASHCTTGMSLTWRCRWSGCWPASSASYSQRWYWNPWRWLMMLTIPLDANVIFSRIVLWYCVERCMGQLASKCSESKNHFLRGFWQSTRLKHAHCVMT